MKIHVTTHDGQTHDLDAVEGWRVMEIIRDHGLPIKAECGGACCCATCHAYIAPDWLDRLPPMRDDEEYMLDDSPDPRETSRLTCQLIFTPELDGLQLELAPDAVP